MESRKTKRGRDHKAQEQHASHDMGEPQLRYGSRFTIVAVIMNSTSRERARGGGDLRSKKSERSTL
jgi:hypothetical protein